MNRKAFEENILLWQNLVESEDAFIQARMEVLSKCSKTDLIELIRDGLHIPKERATALGLVDLLTVEERQQLLGDLLSLAGYVHGLTTTAREIVLSLPREWLLANIEKSAEPLLLYNDYEEYRGLLDLYSRLDRNLTLKLAQRAARRPGEEIREAGEDFLKRLSESDETRGGRG